jgi:hypothetical protein
VPTEARRERFAAHPTTPHKEAAVSKRHWDGMVRAWRRRLHLWDDATRRPDAAEAAAAAADPAARRRAAFASGAGVREQAAAGGKAE